MTSTVMVHGVIWWFSGGGNWRFGNACYITYEGRATNAAVTSGSVPIATSTPVNPVAGPLSPPPLTLAAGQGPHPHEHPPGVAPTVKVTSYPAVLKGRSAASPPNPNLVPSGKVPPPVPPRGTGPSRGPGRSSEAGATASTTSSVSTSSRGDEAAIITRYRLHDSSCDLHRPLPPDHSSTSATTAKTVTSTITAATSSTKTTAISNALHARTTTLDTYRVTHRGNSDRETGGDDDRPMDSLRDWYIQDLDEEFVSVEKVEDAYYIKTSPYPFRPDRGIYRSDRWKEFGGDGDRQVSRKDIEKEDSTKTDHLAKFTYFLNPSSRSDLMNYKMSRKDKKHSETYYERMKRKQRNLEASITTITTMSYSRKSVEDARATDASFHAKNKSIEESVKQKISRFASSKKDSILLQKIREKSRRKKRFAPKPKKQISATFDRSFDEIEKTEERKEDKRLFSIIDFQANKNDSCLTQEKSDKNVKNFKTERQSAIGCNKSSEMKDCSSGRNSNYLGDKSISKIINDEQGNKRSGFKGIFQKGNRVEDEDKEEIVRERITNFNRQTNERLRKYEDSPKLEVGFSLSKNCDESSLFHGKRSLHEDIRKNNPKDMNRDKLLSEALISSSLYNIRSRNSNVSKSSVSEKVKSFEKIKGETKNARQEELYLFNLNEGGVNTIKQKFALPTNKIQLNQGEEKIGLKPEILNTKHERFTIRDDRRASTRANCSALLVGGTLPSTCSTPPPPFDDAVRSNDQTLASGGHLQQGGATILASSLSSAHSKQNKVAHHVTLTKTYHDTVSISDVHLESSGSGSGSGGRETKSSLSVESGGSSRGGGCLTWTPPAGSAEGSTPTWTEGTPSFTESSSSGDIGKLLYALNIYYGS
ncbi:phosphatidylinositol-4-phosphate 5-kinase type-1 alpha [Lasius niger]|uniref:Phosphatidylinositol-4-phosphate 5-kinase type-1 alpha n=1 Tax=Lasius niger TaxID=67767 RepID=A0A0J7KT67_LASNI|nr:phosphatidylinositol-4-phosphate 5-kinase type-1 alpha [Lasius niger]